MYKGTALCLLIAFSVFSLVSSQATMSVSAIIRDQAPAWMTHNNWPPAYWSNLGWTDYPTYGHSGTANGTYGWSNSCFELPMWMYSQNGVQSNGEYCLWGCACNTSNLNTCGRLGSDGTPQYAYTGRSPLGAIQSPACAEDMFHDTNHTIQIPYNFVFQQQASNPQVYEFYNFNFFPIDGQGWQDEGWNGSVYHNYAFCCQLHSYFTYNGGETFDFLGDDDMYVYMGGYLLMDLGGVHTVLGGSVDLDATKLFSLGELYTFDMFYCERHTTASQIQVTTSLQLQCPNEAIDACGVCGGNGQSCCTPADLAACNDNNACTTDLCGVQVTANCQHNQISCAPATNSCVISSCSPSLGCQLTPVNCSTSNKCQIDSCNANTGCVYANVTCPTNACFLGSCSPTSGCEVSPVSCGTSTACVTYSCNNATGCSSTNTDCNGGNLCMIYSCNPTTGCSSVPKNCSDSDPCTIDACVQSTGQCSHTPINCNNGTVCQTGACELGVCVYQNLTCADASDCGVDVCPKISNCSTPQKSCATGGCVYINTSCNTGNPCSIGYCSELTGLCESTPLTTASCLPCNTTACTWNDPCNPQACVNGQCVIQPFNCTPANLCQTSVCVNQSGVASCNVQPITCSSALATDACTPVTCDNTVGCVNLTSTCNDFNPCTVDTCLGGLNNCSHVVPPNVCNDNNVCTTEVCNSSFATLSQACQYTNITCTPSNACQINTGCDAVAGCQFANKTCPPTGAYCLLTSCDNTYGCLTYARTCNVTDPYCYVSACSNSTSSCSQAERPNFNTITTPKKGGVTCLLAYNQKARIAISVGAAAGIAVAGLVALVALVAGGKKGYDLWLASQQGPITAAHPNPLYTAGAGSGTNTLYGGK